MSETRVLIVVLALCLLCLGCAAAPAVDVEAKALEIRELDREWVEAFAEKDVDRAMEFFSSDAVLMPANTPPIVGKESIGAWFESWLPNPAVSSTFSPVEVEVAGSGDLAYDRGIYQFSMDTPEGRIRDSGKYVIVWKMIDGEWKAILDISNSDLATPELVPLGDPEGD